MAGLDGLGWDTACCDLELVWGNLMAGKGLAEKAMGYSVSRCDRLLWLYGTVG